MSIYDKEKKLFIFLEVIMPYVEKLKVIKEEKKVTNAEIEKLSGVPLATITRIFNGQTPNPTFETISHIAIALGTSLDELAGIKQPNAPPIASPIEKTLDSYSELLKEKEDRIKELKTEKQYERNQKHKMMIALFCVIGFVLLILTVDILNGNFGYFRH